MNLYGYANGDPVNYSDPFGLWAVEREQRIDPTREPTALSLGQLSDDIQELKRIGELDVEPIGYACVWLSNILRELGEKTVG